MAEHFRSHVAQHWVSAIHAAKVPVGVINSVADALQEPQIQHRKMVVNIPHSLNQNFKVIGSPIKMSDTPVEYRHAPPQLGEHTVKILSQFLNKEQIQQLKLKGVIE